MRASVGVEMPARHYARHQRPRGPLVREKRVALERLILRLIMHVLTAGGQREETEEGRASARP